MGLEPVPLRTTPQLSVKNSGGGGGCGWQPLVSEDVLANTCQRGIHPLTAIS